MAVLALIFKIAKNDTSLFPNEKYQNIPKYAKKKFFFEILVQAALLIVGI